MKWPLVLILTFMALARGGVASGQEPATPAKIDFNRDIRPILSNHCDKCHGPDAAQRQGGADGLRLDVRDGAIADLGGYAAIVPGQPEKSALVQRITSTDDDERMPPKETGKKLTPREIELLHASGSSKGREYAPHWSYVKPVRPPLPAVKQTAWPRNEIDHFILARLEREGLAPSPEADRAGPASPREPRPDRAAADAGGGATHVRLGRKTEAVRDGYVDQAARLARLRRALGACVARPGPLRRLGRLRRRPAADDLAVSRLRDPRAQRQQAVRPVHDRADRRRPAARIRPTSSSSPRRFIATR